MGRLAVRRVMSKTSPPEQRLFGEIRELIEQSRQQVAVTVNATMTLLYWQIGRRIHRDLLGEKRAKYGLCKSYPRWRGN